jgi:hypothetical protein
MIISNNYSDGRNSGRKQNCERRIRATSDNDRDGCRTEPQAQAVGNGQRLVYQ